jgi:hypothetical protein
MPQSKEQRAAYSKEYRENNKEQIAASKKKYRENNKEQIAVSKKKWKENNKEHISSYEKEYRENNKEQIATYMKEYIRKPDTPAIRRKWRYGISSEDYDTMLEEQDNKCKICFMEFNTDDTKATTPCVDHCHTTDKVRGLLCPLCNRGLGQFKEDIKVLTKAINYLEENNEPIKQ